MDRKKIRVVLTMLVMMITFSFAGITAEAATKTTTKKMTFYVGEKYTYSYIGIGTVKSVKSSKSSVVTAKKKKGKYNEMTAKKKGSATVTVKGSKGTYKYKITVKSKPKFDVKLEQRADGCVTVKVNNKSSVYFDDFKVDVIFKNAAGQEVTTESVNMRYLGAKKSAAGEVYPFPNDGIDYSKTTYKVSYDRDPEKKYSDFTKKVKFSTSLKNGDVIVKTSITYKKSVDIYASYTIYFYDAKGNVVGITDGYNYMSGSSKKYRTNTSEIYMPYDAVSYKIVNKRAMMVKY